jgi:hypothetical protein
MNVSGWVYVCSEPGVWTVGHYDPNGEWHSDSDHGNRQDAATRCNYLNGGRDDAELHS